MIKKLIGSVVLGLFALNVLAVQDVPSPQSAPFSPVLKNKKIIADLPPLPKLDAWIPSVYSLNISYNDDTVKFDISSTFEQPVFIIPPFELARREFLTDSKIIKSNVVVINNRIELTMQQEVKDALQKYNSYNIRHIKLTQI